KDMSYDAADREIAATTGLADVNFVEEEEDLLGSDGLSQIVTSYSARGTVKTVGGSYGPLITGIQRTADGLMKQMTYGDAAGTTTASSYDQRRRLSSVQTYRGPPGSGIWDNPSAYSSSAYDPQEPTLQLLLQDEDFLYDVVGNPVEIRDWRNPEEWPDGAKPVTKKIQYDDLYRATRIDYQYVGGDDDWTSP